MRSARNRQTEYDRENYLFKRLNSENSGAIPNLTTLDVPYRLNQKNWTPPTWAYKRFRKRIETVFSQFNDQFMMIRYSAEGRLQGKNYAKEPSGLFARMTAKVAAFTMFAVFQSSQS